MCVHSLNIWLQQDCESILCTVGHSAGQIVNDMVTSVLLKLDLREGNVAHVRKRCNLHKSCLL
jgi:hypothetical protein